MERFAWGFLSVVRPTFYLRTTLQLFQLLPTPSIYRSPAPTPTPVYLAPTKTPVPLQPLPTLIIMPPKKPG